MFLRQIPVSFDSSSYPSELGQIWVTYTATMCHIADYLESWLSRNSCHLEGNTIFWCTSVNVLFTEPKSVAIIFKHVNSTRIPNKWTTFEEI